MAEELRGERGKLPEASKKSEWGRGMFMAKKRAELNPADYQGKESPEYWKNLIPCTGRPLSSAIHRQKDPQSIPHGLTQ